MGNVTGVDDLIKNLSRIATDKVVTEAVTDAALQVRGHAIREINKQSRGVTYQRGGITHTASAPGDAPNTDTGTLVNSIAVETPQPKTAFVGTSLKYGLWLEIGTGRMAARPWLRPAGDRGHKDLPKTIAQAIRRNIQQVSK